MPVAVRSCNPRPDARPVPLSKTSPPDLPSRPVGRRASLDLRITSHPFADNPSVAHNVAARRDELVTEANKLLNEGWASSTKESYSRALQSSVMRLEDSLDIRLLPIRDSTTLMMVFASLSGEHWSRVKLLKASLRAWHIAHDCIEAFEEAWDCKTRIFWNGLKRACTHDSHAKRSITFAELNSFFEHRLNANTHAGLRDAAMAAFLFFGIKRCNEAVMIRRQDFTFEENHVTCFIRHQKNDPYGSGRYCHIPNLADARFNPTELLQRWAAHWDDTFSSDDASGPFFAVTTKDRPHHVSYDSWRKTTCAFFGDSSISTHSFRKGGTQWFLHQARADPSIVQLQGGWADKATMEKVYAKLSEKQLANQLSEAARGAIVATATDSFNDWINHSQSSEPASSSCAAPRDSRPIKSARKEFGGLNLC